MDPKGLKSRTPPPPENRKIFLPRKAKSNINIHACFGDWKQVSEIFHPT